MVTSVTSPWPFTVLPLVSPIVVNTFVTPRSAFNFGSSSAHVSLARSRVYPSGRVRDTSNSLWSSFGTKSDPTIANRTGVLRNVRTVATTITHRCRSDHPSVPTYRRVTQPQNPRWEWEEPNPPSPLPVARASRAASPDAEPAGCGSREGGEEFCFPSPLRGGGWGVGFLRNRAHSI